MDPRDPEELTAAAAPADADLPAQTRMGTVHLSVADLTRSIAYYDTAIGLQVHHRADGVATLGPAAGEDLLVLLEEPGARPVRRACGLYHFALLVPERKDLARFLAHVARERVPLVGLSDHFVSEAIYLSDPDEHGIEVYWDRPREAWEGRVAERMTTLPLNTDDLLGELDDPAREPFDGLPARTVMGHVHLRVAEIPATVAFYCDTLGFALMAAFGSEAAFLSAGGYHHHVGANTWESAATGQPPPGTATLKQATILLPDDQAVGEARDRLEAAGQDPREEHGVIRATDPSGNPLVLKIDPLAS